MAQGTWPIGGTGPHSTPHKGDHFVREGPPHVTSHPDCLRRLHVPTNRLAVHRKHRCHRPVASTRLPKTKNLTNFNHKQLPIRHRTLLATRTQRVRRQTMGVVPRSWRGPGPMIVGRSPATRSLDRGARQRVVRGSPPRWSISPTHPHRYTSETQCTFSRPPSRRKYPSQQSSQFPLAWVQETRTTMDSGSATPRPRTKTAASSQQRCSGSTISVRICTPWKVRPSTSVADVPSTANGKFGQSVRQHGRRSSGLSAQSSGQNKFDRPRASTSLTRSSPAPPATTAPSRRQSLYRCP